MKQPPPLPLPPPELWTLNTAVQLLLASMVTVPSLQSASPCQPEKKEPLAAVAVRVTTVLRANLAWHFDPQLMPTGEELTVPIPVPPFATVSVICPPISPALFPVAFAT